MAAPRLATSSNQPRNATVPPFVVAVILTVAIGLTAVVVPAILLRSTQASRPRAASIEVSAGKVEVIPQSNAAAQGTVVDELNAFVKVLYERAFLVPSLSADAARSSAAPSVTQRIDNLFTPTARSSLLAHPDVFAPGVAAHIERGRVTLDGVATVDARGALAFLDITFDGNAQVHGVPVALRQTGTLLLSRTEVGWQVSGFDLRLTEAPASPSPSAQQK